MLKQTEQHEENYRDIYDLAGATRPSNSLLRKAIPEANGDNTSSDGST
jgi:hypothetical protein